MDNSVPEESVVMSDAGFVGTPVTTTTTTTTTPPSPTNSGTVISKPKSRGNTGKIIFGLLLLVGGIGAGLILVNQQQLINQKAALGNICHNDSDCGSNEQCDTGVYLCIPLCTANSSCSGNTCTIAAADSGRGFQVKTCTCSSMSGTCNSNCTYGGSNTVATPSCGTIQMDIVDSSKQELACGNTQILLHGPVDCTTPPAGSGSCTAGSCISYGSQNGNPTTGGNCGQIGYDNGAGSCTGGLCCQPKNAPPAPTPTPKPTCGQTCVHDSDCAVTSGGAGFQAVCHLGKCSNPICPDNTVPGSICACNSVSQVPCGELCGANGSSLYPTNCGTNAVCGNNANGGTTGNRCIPNTAVGYVTGGGICKLDPNPAVYCINHTNGTAVTTVADLQAACAAQPTTPPVANNAQCTNLTAYDTSWNALSAAQLSQLKAGTNVYLAVTGTTTSSFDMARFTINGALNPTTSLKKPGSTSIYYYQYTIPSGVTSFTVQAQLHDTATNAWY